MVKQYPDIEVLDTQPADWDVSKVARIWETLLTKYPVINGAFFHNDDMALAAAEVMKRHNRTETLIGGVDAMPPAIEAVLEGRMLGTVRNPSCRIHGGAIVAGVAAVAARRPARASRRTSSPTVRSSPRRTAKACCGCRSTS